MWDGLASQTSKYSTYLDSILPYEMQGSDVSVHAMLEYIQLAGITYEMPASYKLACTHRRETHWHHEAGIDSPSSVRQGREARQRRVSLLVLMTSGSEQKQYRQFTRPYLPDCDIII